MTGKTRALGVGAGMAIILVEFVTNYVRKHEVHWLLIIAFILMGAGLIQGLRGESHKP